MAGERTEAEVIAHLARSGQSIEVQSIHDPHTDSAVPVALVPGQGPKSLREQLDTYLERPRYNKGSAKLTTLASFIDHLTRLGTDDSAVFVSDEHASTIYDYQSPTQTARRAQRASYTFPVSDEWRAWKGADGKAMTQDAFAAFVEDRIVDVVDPVDAIDSSQRVARLIHAEFATPQRLMELSRGLSVRVGARVAQAVNLSSGEGQIAFASEHQDDAGKPLRVPGAFLIQVPVFDQWTAYQIPVRLRYRVKEGAVSWTCELWRAAAVQRDAVRDIAEAVQKAAPCRVYFGVGEAEQ